MKILAFVAFWGLAIAGEKTADEYNTNEISFDGYSKKLYHGMYSGQCGCVRVRACKMFR